MVLVLVLVLVPTPPDYVVTVSRALGVVCARAAVGDCVDHLCEEAPNIVVSYTSLALSGNPTGRDSSKSSGRREHTAKNVCVCSSLLVMLVLSTGGQLCRRHTSPHLLVVCFVNYGDAGIVYMSPHVNTKTTDAALFGAKQPASCIT